MNSFYDVNELLKIGFESVGDDVQISRKASIYDSSKMSLGNHVRIDDFCILSGKIKIGDYVHISSHTSIFAGDAGVEIGSFSGLSSRCAVYAISDDYSGQFLSNATVPLNYRNVKSDKVIIGDNVIVGTGSTILPGVCIENGIAIGCMSLVNKTLKERGVYYGIPVRKMNERSDNCEKLAKIVMNKGKF